MYRSRTFRRLPPFLFLCLAAAAPAAVPPAAAVAGTGGVALEFDTSAASAGAGGATVAAPWIGAPGVWANPALLGFREGLGYHSFHSELVPELADDIEIRDRHLSFGAHGLGFYLGRGPVEGLKLDLGEQVATDEGGNPIGVINPCLKSESLGFGISVGDFVRHHLRDRAPAWTRRVELAWGWMTKSYEQDLGADQVLQDQSGGKAAATLHDIGLLAGFRLVDSIGDPAGFLAAAGGLRVTGAYGRSWLNHGDRLILGEDGGESEVAPRMHVEGWSLRAEIGIPHDIREALAESGRGWIADSLCPLLAFTYADQTITPGYRWDTATETYVFEQDHDSESDMWGLEIAMANVFFVRRGHRQEPGDIDGDTDGWGVQLPLAGIGGFRYDKAEVPQAVGLGDVTRKSWSVWIDVLGLRERLGG